MSETRTPVAASVIDFVTGARARQYPADVTSAARMCLADWIGVAIGAIGEAPGTIMREAMQDGGASLVLSGGTASAPIAALINGTLAHTLDFDDTHVASLTHISGPTWAAVLALAATPQAEGADLLGAFTTGFEVGGRLGSGVGPALLERGVHATAVIGCLAATAAGCALLGLDETQTANALGLAATQAGGLTASFGTMAKPFHAGKAAMNAVIAVQLARAGFTASHEALDSETGLAGALIQDRAVSFEPIGDDRWQILQNTFKPYASCLLTHASIDCARRISHKLKGDAVERAVAMVHPLAIKLAGKRDPRTPLEGKFSLAFCIALGLGGHAVSAADFNRARLDDEAVRSVAGHVELVPDDSLRETAARLSVTTRRGTSHEASVEFALGNPENPMGWPDMEAKFIALTEPRLGRAAKPLFEALPHIQRSGDLAALASFCNAAEQNQEKRL